MSGSPTKQTSHTEMFSVMKTSDSWGVSNSHNLRLNLLSVRRRTGNQWPSASRDRVTWKPFCSAPLHPASFASFAQFRHQRDRHEMKPFIVWWSNCHTHCRCTSMRRGAHRRLCFTHNLTRPHKTDECELPDLGACRAENNNKEKLLR